MCFSTKYVGSSSFFVHVHDMMPVQYTLEIHALYIYVVIMAVKLVVAPPNVSFVHGLVCV